MTLFSTRKPKTVNPLPVVTVASPGPDLGGGGWRLATLGMGWHSVDCACGHTGKVAVAALADRYGAQTRVGHAVEKLQCSQCVRARIRRITLIGVAGPADDCRAVVHLSSGRVRRVTVGALSPSDWPNCVITGQAGSGFWHHRVDRPVRFGFACRSGFEMRAWGCDGQDMVFRLTVS